MAQHIYNKNNMTKINIGIANKPNIKNVEIDKDFNDIKLTDIMPIVKQKYPSGANIIGWAKIN